MPHGNKKSTFQNNKKKRGGVPVSQRNNNTSTGTTSGTATRTGTSVAPSTTGSRGGRSQYEQIPTIHDFPEWSHPPSPSSNSLQQNHKPDQPMMGGHSKLKYATEQFKALLFQLVPSTIFPYNSKNNNTSEGTATSNTTVSATETSPTQNLLDAVDYIYDHVVEATSNVDNGDIVVEAATTDNVTKRFFDIDSQIMIHLKTALSMRKRVMKLYYAGGDDGHQYFYNVLLYCWNTLRIVIKYQQQNYKITSNATKNETGNDDLHNRFAALSMNDILDDTEIEDDAQDVSTSTQQSRPQRPAISYTEVSFEEMVHGDDYFSIIMFLCSMEEMMAFVSKQYKTLKMSWRNRERGGIPNTTYIEDIMEASVYINFCLQQISKMENEIHMDYPYLNTIYRMMMFIVHPHWIKEFTEKISLLLSKSPLLQKSYTKNDTIAFLGDIVETGFRNPSDERSKTEPIAEAFCSKWKVPSSIISTDVEQLCRLGRMEAPLVQEKAMSQLFMEMMTSFGLKAHSWLSRFQFIGGQDRCMIHTVRLLQGLSNVVKKGKPLILKRGFFGRQWDERRNRANKITEDMDEFLMGDVLPTLFSMCTDGMLSTNLPRERELLTFFTVMKSFTKNSQEPITWTFAFAIHALLTSVVEMQGQDDVKLMGNTAKSCFNQYFAQVQDLTNENPDSQSKHWAKNLKSMLALRWLVYPVMKPSEIQNGGPDHETVINRAIWNPLCSGLFMEYICYFSNLDGGMAMIDSFAQLRIVLHLYNAFLQLGAFNKGDVDFMDWLHEIFKDCKGVWAGPIPIKGEFVKRFWIAYGASIPSAQQKATDTHARIRNMIAAGNGTLSSYDRSTQAPRGEHRSMTPINPEDISISFERICLHEFSDLNDRYHTDKQRNAAKGTIMYDLAVRCNDTFDHMDKEQRILASNYTVIGHRLNYFIEKLVDVLGWTLMINQIINETPDSVKSSRRVDGRSVRPNSWEASDINFRRQAIVILIADRLLGTLDVAPSLDVLPIIDRSLPRTAASFMSYFQRFDPHDILFFSPYTIDDEE